MTVHKLSAGDGYTYLTRQVASADELRPRGQSLTDYYAARGNPPGAWLGEGAEQLGISGQAVREDQMRSLFGAGLHPNAEAMRAAGAPESATKLGRAFPSYADLAPYPQRVAAKVAEFAAMHDRPPSEAERNQIAAKEAQRGRRAVAGFDLVFTPVKSASLLWGLSTPEVRQQVEDAHHAAVTATMAWVEEHAAFTRTGHGGIAQVEATGLVCAAFDHRESRSGDPDLHTHVAVANKVRGPDGKWRSLDARGLYGLGVAASERYNTRFEDELARRLGVRFDERPGVAADKRPIREIAGIPPELIGHFSRRRAAIESRLTELRREYRDAHGREPDRSTQLQLAQQATLETREGKPPGRTLHEQVTDWRTQAAAVLGKRGLERALRTSTGREQDLTHPDDGQLQTWAGEVVRRISEQRSTWTVWNVAAEAERLLRPLRFDSPAEREGVTDAVVAEATGPRLSIRIGEPELITEAPELTRKRDGHSAFVAHGSDRFTTSEVLLAEDALVAAGRTHMSSAIDDVVAQAAIAIHESSSGVVLDRGQRALVETFASSPHRLVVGVGPAGAGKTTAMQAFAQVWRTNGGRVIPLATSSKAAQVLGAQLGGRAENLHKFLHENDHPAGGRDDWFQIRTGDVVLVDEAGMAGTRQLARLLELVEQAGASLRLLGDPAQLAAVDAGGALRLLEHEVGATHLTDLHRFTDPDEGAASLALRDGDADALAFYTHRDRIRSGSRDAMLESAYAAWAADIRVGKTSLLVAATSADVSALNTRARLERISLGHVGAEGILLRDGNRAGIGDWVVTRENARTLGYRRNRWVHNGDTWRVVRRHRNGSLTVKHLENQGTVRLPAAYVDDSLELAYASTAHRVQGTTTDTAHALVTSEMTREALYVASTRGRDGTIWYAATDTGIDLGCDQPEAPRTATEVLTTVLKRVGAEGSATETLRAKQDGATSLPALVGRYDHARSVASLAALALATETLPSAERPRILGDKAAPYLARILAGAAGRGADPGRVLRAAIELDELADVRSPALVLATRIEDHPHSLGIPDRPSTEPPLPWLDPPDVGHPGWLPYLTERARLITSRRDELGSPAAAYRDQYDIHDPAGIGEPPEPGTRRASAYAAAQREQLREKTASRTADEVTWGAEHPVLLPSRSTMARDRVPRLSR